MVDLEKKILRLMKEKDCQQAHIGDFLQPFLILLRYFSMENENFLHPELTQPTCSLKALQGCQKKEKKRKAVTSSPLGETCHSKSDGALTAIIFHTACES